MHGTSLTHFPKCFEGSPCVDLYQLVTPSFHYSCTLPQVRGPVEISAIFADPAWTRAVWFRDPLDRWGGVGWVASRLIGWLVSWLGTCKIMVFVPHVLMKQHIRARLLL